MGYRCHSMNVEVRGQFVKVNSLHLWVPRIKLIRIGNSCLQHYLTGSQVSSFESSLKLCTTCTRYHTYFMQCWGQTWDLKYPGGPLYQWMAYLVLKDSYLRKISKQNIHHTFESIRPFIWQLLRYTVRLSHPFCGSKGKLLMMETRESQHLK